MRRNDKIYLMTRKKVRRYLWFGLIIILIIVIFLLPRILANSRTARVMEYYDEVQTECTAKYSNLSPELVLAVIAVESGGTIQISSHAGAMGLMQIIPSTGRYLARKAGITDFATADLYDPVINVRLGCMYLSELMDKYNNNEQLALSAYNGGPGAVSSYLSGGTLPRETVRYSPNVLSQKEVFAAEIIKFKEREDTLGEDPAEVGGVRGLFLRWLK